MFACLYKPDQPVRAAHAGLSSTRAESGRHASVSLDSLGTGREGQFRTTTTGSDARGGTGSRLLDVARLFSPRVDARSETLITLEVDGLTRLFGDDKAVGDRLRRAAADAGLGPVHVAIAATRTTAILCAAARAGVTVVPAGEEAAVLAPLPLRTLEVFLPSPACYAEAGTPHSKSRVPHTMPRLPAGSTVSPQAGVLGSPRSSVARTRAGLPALREIEGEPGVPRQSPVSGLSTSEPRTLGAPRPVSPLAGGGGPNPAVLPVLSRWGIRTLDQLVALPAVELSERIGQEGLAWQRLARGEDTGPLVPTRKNDPFEATAELEWPIEGLEPLSFVLGGLLDALCQRLERRDRGAAVLHLQLRLVTKDTHTRTLQLPAPMRDAKVLRTLLLLDLESHQPPAGVDHVTVAIDPTPDRIVQESLLTRALPAPEQVSTLLARLGALMGDTRCGSPALVDSHRPGAFAMVPFRVPDPRPPNPWHAVAEGEGGPNPESRMAGFLVGDWGLGAGELTPDSRTPNPACHAEADVVTDRRRRESRLPRRRPQAGPTGPGTPQAQPTPRACLRRFRFPIPARVLIDHNRPIVVNTDRPGLSGGRVHTCAGPWRTSGEWWKTSTTQGASGLEALRGLAGWNRDEWDVALADGGLYRIFEDRESGRWFVEAVVD